MSIIAKCAALDRQFRDFHQSHFTPSWLNPTHTRLYICLALLMAVIAIAANGHMRSWQFAQWQARPDIYFVNDMPSVSTADAGYFLAMAKAIKTEGNSDAFRQKRLFPNDHDRQNNSIIGLTKERLLSVIIAYFAPDATNRALLETAHKMLPITAMITALAIICAFGIAGFWWEGAIAALGGGLSLSYLSRTAVGRIDTDQLNLGFFYAVTALVILAGRVTGLRAAIMVSIIAGGMNWLFSWWYPKDIFSCFFVGMLIWVGLLTHRDIKRTGLQVTIFILLSGTFVNMSGVDLDIFTDSKLGFSTLIFPNTLQTISELNVIPFINLLVSITGNPVIGAFGIICLLIWVIFNPIIGIAMLPILGLGMLNFIFGNRVVFYAAPIVWFGVGWGIFVLMHFTKDWLVNKYHSTPLGTHMPYFLNQSSIMTMPVCALLVTGFTYLNSYNPLSRPYLPKPSFSREVLNGFVTLNGHIASRPDPKPAVIASWWDYGYIATFLTDIASLHDGGTQTSPITHYIARALTAKSQAESAAILTFLAEDGIDGIREKSMTKGALEATFASFTGASQTDIYLVLTHQMVPWMEAISKIGMWNAEHGKPINIRPNDNNLEYRSIRCSRNNTSPRLICAGLRFDLTKGTINQKPRMSRMIETRKGQIVAQRQYAHRQGLVMQMHHLGNQTMRTHVLHPRLYQTSFNKLFYLGAANPQYFSLIEDKFPYYRVYKVKN